MGQDHPWRHRSRIPTLTHRNHDTLDNRRSNLMNGNAPSKTPATAEKAEERQVIDLLRESGLEYGRFGIWHSGESGFNNRSKTPWLFRRRAITPPLPTREGRPARTSEHICLAFTCVCLIRKLPRPARRRYGESQAATDSRRPAETKADGMSKPSTKAGKHPQTKPRSPGPRGSAPSARSVATVPAWKTAIAFTAQPWQPQRRRPTDKDYQSPARTGRDGRTTNTANIGKPKPTTISPKHKTIASLLATGRRVERD